MIYLNKTKTKTLGRGQRLRSLGQGRAGPKAALPRAGAGRDKDCTPPDRGGQGQRLRSLEQEPAGAKAGLPRVHGRNYVYKRYLLFYIF